MWGYLFSFHGRINRAKLWAFYLVQFGFQLAVAAAQAILIGDTVQDIDSVQSALAQPRVVAFFAIGILLTIPLAWGYVAVIIKRLHDRNRSGWWFVVFYLLPLLAVVALAMILQASGVDPNAPPFVAILIGAIGIAGLFQLWAFVELYILPGTAGDNRFGPDPLAAPGSQA